MIALQHRFGANHPQVVRLLRVTARAWGLSAAASSHSFRVHSGALPHRAELMRLQDRHSALFANL
jgi:hypothetical protein